MGSARQALPRHGASQFSHLEMLVFACMAGARPAYTGGGSLNETSRGSR